MYVLSQTQGPYQLKVVVKLQKKHAFLAVIQKFEKTYSCHVDPRY